MACGGPPAKRAKHVSMFPGDDDMGSESDASTITRMDSDSSDFDDCLSDASTVEWLSKSTKSVNKNAGKPFVLKVPRKYTRVPQYLHSRDMTSSALEIDRRNRHISISKSECDALELMPLDAICVVSDSSPEFKEIAAKFFAVKYRELQLSSLADPKTGKFTLVKVQRLLRHFGHLIWSLALNLEQLDGRDSCADLLALVRNHCSQTLGWMVL